jgi:rhomboid protease GluP
MLLAYLGWGGERTDVGGHVAGFAAGTVLGLALGRYLGPLPRGPRAQGLYGLLACGLLALAWLLALRGAG